MKYEKQQTNGKKGEVRTESILSDNFIISDRSIDIDGADFVIEEFRTTKSRNQFELRISGLVQAKYIQDNKTAINIKSDYVITESKEIRSDFFLFIHTGDDDERIRYFLTAQDIIDHFDFKENKFYFKFSKK